MSDTTPSPTLDKLTFTLSSDSTYYSVKALNDSISGDVVIPDTYEGKPVTLIENQAFYACVMMTSVIIPNSVTSIGESAFLYCLELSSITIPDSITSIGEQAFYYCTALTSVTIGNNVTSIGIYAFRDCGALTSVTIPASVDTIRMGAFKNCATLNTVIIEGTPEVEFDAFSDTPNLEKITVYEGKGYSASDTIDGKPIEIVGGQAPEEPEEPEEPVAPGKPTLDKLTFTLSLDETYYTVKDLNSSISGEVIIPAEYEGKPVKEIEEYAFFECSALTSVIIPDSVTSIGQFAFYYCYALTSVTIGNSVTSIGNTVFQNCSDLISIKAYEGTPYGTVGAYAGGKRVTEVIPATAQDDNFYYYKNDNGYKIIAKTSISGNISVPLEYNGLPIVDCSFYKCSSLTSVTIPDGVTTIGDSAFYQCSKLTSITIPDSVTSIGKYVFTGCSALSSITVDPANTAYKSEGNCLIEKATNKLIRGCNNSTIPDSVTSIGNSAFSGYSGLTSIDIPNSVKSIGDSAFYGCSKLTSITIPNNVTSIGNMVFYSCNSLASVVIGNSVTSIGNDAFNRCSALRSINIPDSVTSIGTYAFAYCTALKSINIPAGVTSIGDETFYYCWNLTSITIPNSVTSIREYAFAECSALKNVIIKGKPTVNSRAFDRTTKLEKIYVIEGKGYSPTDTIGGKPIEILPANGVVIAKTMAIKSMKIS